MFKDTILGIIYLIKHKTCDDKKVYVGSTINLKKRIWRHKCSCNNEKNKDYNINLYKYIRENGGFNEYEFIILECYVCNFKYELYDREDDYIKMYPNNLNKFRAYLTRQEIKEYPKKYYDENKDKELDRHKKYYDENKDKVLEKNKKYRDENKDKIKEKNKKYCDENKDKIKKYYDENKEKIKERIKEKITCECGSIVRKNDIARHRKTLKHIAYIEQKNNVIL
jgi:hypothetical protein